MITQQKVIPPVKIFSPFLKLEQFRTLEYILQQFLKSQERRIKTAFLLLNAMKSGILRTAYSLNNLFF